MAVEWSKAPDHVVKMFRRTVDEHHTMLKEARIAVVWRSEAPASKGRVVFGKAEKVSDKWKMVLKERYDFLIWIADDSWGNFNPDQQRAAVDHLLCMCRYDGEAAIVRPDVEEFIDVIARHGLWRWELAALGEVMEQAPLIELSKNSGTIDAVKIGEIPFDSGRVVDTATGEIVEEGAGR